jgi:integrase/recombinase XerD
MIDRATSVPRDVPFHAIKDEYSDASLEHAREKGIITQSDVALLNEYIGELRSSKNIGVGRKNKIVFTLVGWRRFIGPFDQLTMADIYEGISKLKTGTNARGVPFKQNTLRDFITILKSFTLWLIDNNRSSLPESKIRKLKTPSRDSMTKTAADLLTPEEITSMIEVCTRSIDRAIIMMLYEGGFRIGELGALKWGDLKFDEFGVIANVRFKTEKPRYLRLVMAREHLAKWRTDYPFRPEGENPVFITERKTPLTHASIQKQLKRLAARAKIEKHITPHIFRHSRITHLIKEGIPESVIKLMMWGNVGSSMFQTYAHLAGTDIDSAILKNYNIIASNGERPQEARLEPHQCAHCYTVNAPTSNYCSTCGHALTDEAKGNLMSVTEAVESTPIYQHIMEIVKAEIARDQGSRGVQKAGLPS